MVCLVDFNSLKHDDMVGINKDVRECIVIVSPDGELIRSSMLLLGEI